jgi:hypothetical protein
MLGWRGFARIAHNRTGSESRLDATHPAARM